MQHAKPFLKRKTAPDGEPVSLSEAKGQLRIDDADTFDDADLAFYISAATELLDGPSGRLSRALLSQTWTQFQPRPYSSTSRVWLQLSTVTSIVSVKYYDADDQLQTMDLTTLRSLLMEAGAYIEPSTGVTWPTMADRDDALQIEFVAGFGDAADVPTPIKQAIRLIVSHWASEREAAVVVDMNEIPFGVDALIEPYKLAGWAK